MTKSPWSALAVTSLAIFAVNLDTTVLFVAFPAIRRTFAEVSAAELSWVLNAYTIVFGALLVPAGRLADRIGRRRLFTAGVGVFTVASLACGLAPSPATLVAARALQAVGAAMLLPSSLAIVLAAFPRPQWPVAVSLWGAVGALSAAVGPSLGSLIIDTVGWRWVFFINLPVGVVAVLATRRAVAESRDPDGGHLPDPLGIALVVAAVGLMALAIVQGDAWGWTSVRTLAAALAGVVLFAAFIAETRLSRTPVLDLSLFDDRTYRLANLATLLFAIAFSAMFFGFILFQTQVWHYSILRAGLGVTPGPLTVIPFAIVGGRIAARRGHREVLVAGGLLYALGGIGMTFGLTAAPAYLTRFLPAALFTGAGVGLILPSLSAAAVFGLPPSRFAVGSAVNQAVRQLGSVLGVAIVVAILAAAPTLAGFSHVFLLLVFAGLGTSVIALGIDTKGAPPPPHRHSR
jgi:EmrB/QacA subfamily drug resistance transporter